MKRVMIFLSGLVVAWTLSLTANAGEGSAEKLQSAEEIEALLNHLGLYDADMAELEENEYQTQARQWRRRPPHRRPPMHRRPPHRRPPYRRPPIRRAPPRAYLVTCQAENARGHRFWHTSYSAYVSQQRAMDECYRFSRYCYQLGCYYGR